MEETQNLFNQSIQSIQLYTTKFRQTKIGSKKGVLDK